jgi:hypothetical protein
MWFVFVGLLGVAFAASGRSKADQVGKDSWTIRPTQANTQNGYVTTVQLLGAQDATIIVDISQYVGGVYSIEINAQAGSLTSETLYWAADQSEAGISKFVRTSNGLVLDRGAYIFTEIAKQARGVTVKLTQVGQSV